MLNITDILGIVILLGPLIGSVLSLTLSIVEVAIQNLTHNEMPLTRRFMILFFTITYSITCYILVTNLEITILHDWLHLIYYVISVFGNFLILWKLTDYL
jgi:uncharacterized membrane protein